MLAQFRSLARSLGTKILLGLLIITFAVWGVEDMFKQPTIGGNVATVGDLSISTLEYQKALNEQVERMRQTVGKQFSPELLINLGLGTKILQTLVDAKLLAMESRKLGIRISDEEIASNIRKSREFFDNKGKFSKEIFDNFLKRMGISEKKFIERMRDDIAVRLLINTITNSVKTPQNAANIMLKSKEEQRVVELYSITPAMIKSNLQPDDAQLRDYYDSNKKEFTAPEYRTISYVTLSNEDAKKYLNTEQHKNSEKQTIEIENIYRERIEEFKKPEQREVEQLLFGNEEAAKAAYTELKSGISFDNVAKHSNILNPKTMSLGLVEKSNMMEEAADSVFTLENNNFSSPIKSSFGWHIFLVKKIVPVSTLSLDEVRPQIEKELEQQAKENALIQLSNNIEDAIASGSKLEEIAKEFNLTLVTLQPLDKNGKLADGNALKDIPDSDKFLDIAFKSDEKVESQIINGKAGKSFVLRVDHVTNETLLPFADVKSKIITAWQKKEKSKQLYELAQKISNGFIEPANRNATLSSHAMSAPTVLTVTQKKEDVKKLPLKMISDIFILNIGESSPPFELDNGDYGIVILRAINTDVINQNNPEYTIKISEIGNAYKLAAQNEMIEQYLRYLATKHTININKPMVDAAIKSESGS